jgi:hypothetical protein
MPSSFAWVDFAEEDRRKMAEVIDLFREQDTRDELGLGAIRDGLADLMFPGTSTIQTRARYFLFVPWIYRRHEGKTTAGVDVSKRARADEIKLIEALVNGGERDGVIGIEKRAQLQRLASSIYWAGLGILRVRRFVGSQDQYHRSWDSLLRRSRHVALDDDEEPLDGAAAVTWDPELPDSPADFLKETTLALSKKEAEYLQERVLGLGETLLGHLVSHTAPARDCEFVWSHPEYRGFPARLRTHVEHARLFSEAMHGAALLYNLMLSEARSDDELRIVYRERFSSWAALLDSRTDAFGSWRRDEFWTLVESTPAHVGARARRFVDGWLDRALGAKNLEALADASDVRALIAERERILKRARARLSNPRALERWNGSAGAQQLNYRWHRVRAIVADVLEGLGD